MVVFLHIVHNRCSRQLDTNKITVRPHMIILFLFNGLTCMILFFSLIRIEQFQIIWNNNNDECNINNTISDSLEIFISMVVVLGIIIFLFKMILCVVRCCIFYSAYIRSLFGYISLGLSLLALLTCMIFFICMILCSIEIIRQQPSKITGIIIVEIVLCISWFDMLFLEHNRKDIISFIPKLSRKKSTVPIV